jgi:hypothetical protein
MNLKTVTVFAGVFTALSAILEIIGACQLLPKVDVPATIEMLSRVCLALFLFVLYARQVQRR